MSNNKNELINREGLPLWAQVKMLEHGCFNLLAANLPIKEVQLDLITESLFRSFIDNDTNPDPNYRILKGDENTFEAFVKVLFFLKEEIKTLKALLKISNSGVPESSKGDDFESQVEAARIRMYGPLTEEGKRIEMEAILRQCNGTPEEQKRMNEEFTKKWNLENPHNPIEDKKPKDKK